MSLSQSVQKILQEVAILGTGNAVNAATIAELEKYVGTGDDFSPLVDLVNSYMTNRAAAEGGTAQVLKTAASDALGLTLSNEEADAIAAQLDAGEITWADIFAQVITSTEVAGQILHNRSEAAQSFLSSLASTGKSAFFDGAAVNSAVKNLLQGIGGSGNSLSNAKSAFAVLAANLKANGIESAVADGYVKNATVFVDANGDGILNAGEWSTTTDASGNYLLPSNISGAKIIAFGGADIMTGKPYQGVLTAPVGSTVVNPLTTLVQSLIETGKAATVESAASLVQKALDLPANINLLSYDPLAILADANASADAKNTALSVQASALQVSNIVAQIGSAIDAAGSDDKLTAAQSVISALADTVSTGKKVNLSSSETLTAIVKSAARDANTDKVANAAQDLVKITAASNEAASKAQSITELSKSATVAQDTAVTAIISGITNNNLGSAVSNFTGNALTSKIDQAIPQNITPEVKVPLPANGSTGGGSGSSGGSSGGSSSISSGSGSSGSSDSGGGGNGNTTDHDAPFLEFTIPYYGQILAADGAFMMAFNEAVKAGGGSIVISSGSDTRTIDVNNSQVSFDGNSVIIKPQNVLAVDTAYQIKFASGVITDLAGNSFAGGNIRFTTIPSNPILSWSDPGDDATDFQVDSDIRLNFNEAVKAGSGNIVISNGSDTRTIAVTDTSQVTFYGYQVIINPATGLVPNTNYHITIANSAITDLAGNAYAGINDATALNFTTIASNPILSWSEPGDDATDFQVDSAIRLNFNEAVKAGSGSIVISNGSDMRTIAVTDTSQVTFARDKNGNLTGQVVINPATDLQANSGYHVEIPGGAIIDLVGNAYAGINDPTVLNFTTQI